MSAIAFYDWQCPHCGDVLDATAAEVDADACEFCQLMRKWPPPMVDRLRAARRFARQGDREHAEAALVEAMELLADYFFAEYPDVTCDRAILTQEFEKTIMRQLDHRGDYL